MKNKALFITIEGLEGSGKSSLITFLQGALRKRRLRYVVFREPGTTKIGEKIRAILLDKANHELSRHTELLLYLAARTQLIEEKLLNAIKRYDVVICDRFFDSTLVYQGYAQGLGQAAEKAVKDFSLGLKPDLTMFLDVAPEEGLNRIKNKDRIESRPIPFHKKLRTGYLRLAAREPGRIKVIDASGRLEDIYRQALRILGKKLCRQIKKY